MTVVAAACELELDHETGPSMRCIDCGAALEGSTHRETSCVVCGRHYPLANGLLVAQGELTGRNRIAADFYNSERWRRFRPFEQMFLKVFGGLPGARKQILRHLPDLAEASLLEVGINDGENVCLLPRRWQITGIDIAHRPLAGCRDRFGDRVTLVQAEGEKIPFADRSFDAVLCVGGFNFFSNPTEALHEMARVTQARGRIVVADEIPTLYEWGWGHLLGAPAFDRWLMERFWFGPEFTAMALSNDLDVAEVARSALGPHRLYSIWRGFGYCLVGTPPEE